MLPVETDANPSGPSALNSWSKSENGSGAAKTADGLEDPRRPALGCDVVDGVDCSVFGSVRVTSFLGLKILFIND